MGADVDAGGEELFEEFGDVGFHYVEVYDHGGGVQGGDVVSHFGSVDGHGGGGGGVGDESGGMRGWCRDRGGLREGDGDQMFCLLWLDKRSVLGLLKGSSRCAEYDGTLSLVHR